MTNFYCPKCGEDFEAEWTFGEQVRCPHCRTWFETDYEENGDCEVQGPWIAGEATEEKKT